MATIVHIHWVARWYEVNMVSAILLDNVEDTRTITVSVEDFLKLDFADTEDNTRKIKQIEEEAAKFDSKFFRLVQRIKSPFGFWTKSISPKSLLDLPVPRQHGALVWRSICRSFSTCIPKQRRSERRPSASIASTTNLYSSTSYSLSSGSEPEQEQRTDKHKTISNSRTPSAPPSKQYDANEETLQSLTNAMFPGWRGISTLSQPGVGQDEYTAQKCYEFSVGPLYVGKIICYTWGEHDKSVTAIVKQKVKRKGHEINAQMRFEVTKESRQTFSFGDFIPLFMSSRS